MLQHQVVDRDFSFFLITRRTICNHLGIPKAKVLLDKFKGGETRVEIEESVRGKDVFIIQSGGGKGMKPPRLLLARGFADCPPRTL